MLGLTVDKVAGCLAGTSTAAVGTVVCALCGAAATIWKTCGFGFGQNVTMSKYSKPASKTAACKITDAHMG